MAVNFTGSYSENFDTLANTATSSTLPTDWLIAETGANANTTYTAGTGSGNAGDTYSFGAAGSTDRALGVLRSGSLIPNFGTSFTNNTGGALTSLNVSYQGEQWRLGTAGRADRLDFQYSTNATSLATGTWVDVDALDFSSVVTTGTAGLLDGNVNKATVASTISGLNIAAGSTVWVRWQDLDATGADDGLAIDNFSISTSNPGPVDTLPQVSIEATANAAETNEAPGSFRISRTGATTNALVVNYSLATGTTAATPVTDYQANPALSGSVTINAGSSSATIAITPVDDAVIDPAETVTLNLTTATAYSLSSTQATATVTIVDNDVPVASEITKIHAIQGSGSATTLTGTRTIEGVVVGAFNGATKLNGFYVQEEDGDTDGNAATSEGIFVFDPTGLFSGGVGNKVRVTGTIGEFTTTSSGVAGASRTSLTQLTSITSVVNQGIVALPTVTNIVLPVVDDSALEAYEGMLVNVSAATGPLTVTETFKLGRFGQVGLSSGGRLDQFTQTNAPSVSGNAAYLDNLLDRYIILDDGSGGQNPDPTIHARGGQPLSASNTLRGGDTIASITGVLDERFEGYRVQTTTPANFIASNPRPVTAPDVGGTLRVASANLLNYFTDLDSNPAPNNPIVAIPNGVSFEPRGANTAAEFTRQRDKTIQSLLTLNADVIGIQEMENDGVKSLQDLVNGLNAIAGAGTYAFINDQSLVNDPNPAINAVGTDAIKVGILYKPGKVTPVGTATTYLEANPTSPIFSRPPVAQTFADANGEKFTVTMNHFKSKSPGGATGADLDQNDGQGAYNAKRVAQSEALLSFISSIKASSGDNDVLVIGDLNAYAKEDPITTLTNGGLTNLLGPSSYSYQFNGQWGALDHALVSSSLASQVTGAAKYHINADEPIVLDYNTEFKSAGQVSSFYAANGYRASDHDPLVIGLNLATTAKPLTLIGTIGNDTLTGAAGNDLILGLGGNDTVSAGAGDDSIFMGAGNDTIAAGEGNNSVYGNAGANSITAGAGNDKIYAEAGDDVVNAGNGDNEVFVGEGNNRVTTGSGNDLIGLGAGNDIINAGDGNNRVDAGDGNDTIAAGDGNNTFYGGAGNNSFTTGTGNDKIYAEAGDDVVNAGNGDNEVFVGEGNNRVTTGSGNDLIGLGAGNDIINAGDGTNRIFAGDGNNQIMTGLGDDLIYAGSGNDIILTGAGNDLIYAGNGNNQINAGIGTDFVGLGDGANIVTLNAGLGAVTIIGFGADDRLTLSAGSVPSELTIARIGHDTLISKGSDLFATLQGTSVTAPMFI
jgi:uncharacterized protein